jgi:hypothetical protein
MRNYMRWQRIEHNKNDQFNSKLDFILASLKVSSGAMKAEKEERINTDIDKIFFMTKIIKEKKGIEGQEIQNKGYNVTLLKVELSSFNVENPRDRLGKYRKFFKLNFIPVQQWV